MRPSGGVMVTFRSAGRDTSSWPAIPAAKRASIVWAPLSAIASSLRLLLRSWESMVCSPMIMARDDGRSAATIRASTAFHDECGASTYLFRAPDHMGQFYLNHVNMGLDVAAPFLDYRNAHVGMRLLPWQTVFTQWHRSVITRACPEIATLPTSDGYTASNRWVDLPRNLTGYAAVQVRRAAKKMGQRKLGRTMFHKAGAFTADAPSFMACLRDSAPFRGALDSLKAAGILRPDLASDGIRDIHVGRAFTIGMLYRRLEQPKHGRGASRIGRLADGPRMQTSRGARFVRSTMIDSAIERGSTNSRAARVRCSTMRLRIAKLLPSMPLRAAAGMLSGASC